MTFKDLKYVTTVKDLKYVTLINHATEITFPQSRCARHRYHHSSSRVDIPTVKSNEVIYKNAQHCGNMIIYCIIWGNMITWLLYAAAATTTYYQLRGACLAHESCSTFYHETRRGTKLGRWTQLQWCRSIASKVRYTCKRGERKYTIAPLLAVIRWTATNASCRIRAVVRRGTLVFAAWPLWTPARDGTLFLLLGSSTTVESNIACNYKK
jgi:hypothetical protein